MYRSQSLTLVFALAVALSTGCKGSHSPSEPPTGPDFIQITNLAPPDGTVLARGSSATITATVSYSESCRGDAIDLAGGGTITMDISDQTGNRLSPEVSKSVGIEQGSATLSAHVNVPATGVAQVDVTISLVPATLSCQLQEFLPLSVSVTYPVGP